MPLSPGAADGSCDDRSANALRGDVHGQLVQARDIHGGVTIHASQAPPPPPPLVDVSLDAPRPATAVRGREELLAVLGREMRAGAPVPHVLTGPGGFGKTTVAAALAERARAEGWTVFWVRPGDVAAGMVEAAVEAGGPRREAEQVRTARYQAVRWVWRHLDAAPRPWLLVIDNADRPAELDPENRPGDQLGWMRSSPGGFVLVTSRVDDPLLWSPARVHRVGELDAPAAAAALADHAGLAELAGAEELAVRLGGVPLALSLAGRILATHGVLFPDAHALLDRLREDVGALDGLAAPFVPVADADRGLLSGVWELSLRLVAEREPKAAPLLRILAVLGSGTVPVPLRRLPLSELAAGVLGPLDEASFARAVNALVVHGLVTVERREAEAFLRLHPLVAETVRAGLTDADLPLVGLAERLLRWRADHDPVLETGAYAALNALLSRMHDGAHPALVRTSTLAHRAMMLLGRREEAESGLREIVDRSNSCLGRDHTESMRSEHALADAVRALERIGEAEELYLSVARRRESVLGPTHPETLSSRHQAALMAGLRGDLDTAEAGFRAVLLAHTGTSEEDSTAVHALENLSYVHMFRGELDTAEEGFLRVREIRVRTLGELHRNTVMADFNLAQLAFERGERRKAAEGFRQAAEYCEQFLGDDHSLTLSVREWWEKADKQLPES